MTARVQRGMLDTCTVIDLPTLDPTRLPVEVAIPAVVLAELARPAQRDRALGQPVLQPRRLLVIVDPGGGGLADIDRRQPVTMPGLNLAPRPLLRQPRCEAHRAHPRSRRSPHRPSARPAGPADGSRPPGSPPGTPPTPARLPAPAGSRGHGSISRHRSPPMSAMACTSPSRRTSAATASRPSIPMTGGSPWRGSPMYAV